MAVGLEVFERQLVERVTELVHDGLSVAAAAGASTDDLGEPKDLARRMAAVLPTAEPYDTLVGPFYDTAGVATWLGLTRQAVHHRAKVGQLLGCPTVEGRIVFPAWQFRDDGSPVEHLADVLTTLRAGAVSPWTIALWLRAPADELDGQRAADWLAAGLPYEPVLTAAGRAAARWAS